MVFPSHSGLESSTNTLGSHSARFEEVEEEPSAAHELLREEIRFASHGYDLHIILEILRP
jgi:hypothetical protein